MSDPMSDLFARIRGLKLTDQEKELVDQLEALADENAKLDSAFASSFAHVEDSSQTSTRSISRTFHSISQTFDDTNPTHTITVSTPSPPPPAR